MSGDESTRAQRDSLKETKARSGAGRVGAYGAVARYLDSVHYSSARADAKRPVGQGRDDEA